MNRRPPHPSIDDAIAIDELMLQVYALTRIFNLPNESGLLSKRAQREGLAFLATFRDALEMKHPDRKLTWDVLRQYTRSLLLALADKIDGNLVDAG